MARPDNVPSAADIFLKRKSTSPRKSRATLLAPGLFDSLEVETREDPPVRSSNPQTPPVLSEAPSPPPDAARVWTVAGLVSDVRAMVEARFGRVTVDGEISNWRPAASGHCYFTLKDGTAQLSAIMFRREAALLRFRPNDGDQVRLRGQVSVYESRGQMQLIAESMELAGIGAQLAAVQELKAKLKREGLFSNQRPLPAFPRCIGVVTSLQGAALRDIIKVCRRRHAAVNLLIYPAAVQGPRCAIEIAAGIRWFSSRKPGEKGQVDVVLVARGGGSWEDLHGFDDELVARAMASCSVPVIAGIGHATDTTIADAAADVCAPTPSAAAELLTATQHGVEQRVERLSERIARAGRYEVLRARQKVSRLSADSALRRLLDSFGRRAQRVDDLEFRTHYAALRNVAQRMERLTRLETRLRRQDVKWQLAQSTRKFEILQTRLRLAGAVITAPQTHSVDQLVARAEAMSPLRVLERGYALVYGPDGALLRSATAANPGDRITARLTEGSVEATVVETK